MFTGKTGAENKPPLSCVLWNRKGEKAVIHPGRLAAGGTGEGGWMGKSFRRIFVPAECRKFVDAGTIKFPVFSITFLKEIEFCIQRGWKVRHRGMQGALFPPPLLQGFTETASRPWRHAPPTSSFPKCCDVIRQDRRHFPKPPRFRPPPVSSSSSVFCSGRWCLPTSSFSSSESITATPKCAGGDRSRGNPRTSEKKKVYEIPGTTMRCV